MKKIIALLLVVAMIGCFAGCGKKETKKIVIAEKESAGESVAKTDKEFKNYEYVSAATQANALMEVNAGTADVAIVDYVMSIGSIGKGTDYEKLVVEGNGYAAENYGIAFRKGSDITAKVNEAIAELKADGTLAEIGGKYKLADIITATDTFEPFVQNETDSDWEYIKNKGTLVIGITYFAPMNYIDDDGNLVGFETEFAKAVCEKLGLKAEFQKIDWGTKEAELAAKSIDCIWNGMTITDERAEQMSISIPYMSNKQVKVVKAK